MSNNYSLPHNELRPKQGETIEKLLDFPERSRVILEAATGFGKTALPAAISTEHTVTTLCRTKMLQKENYATSYSFDALFGRGNYLCSYDTELTAGSCEYAEMGMHKCPEAKSCAYLNQKALVKASCKRSLNYAYWLAAKNWRRNIQTDYLFLDEAHLLSDITLDWAGCTISGEHRQEWSLPPFPQIQSAGDSMFFVDDNTELAIEWLCKARDILAKEYSRLTRAIKNNGSNSTKKRQRKCETFGLKIRATLDAIQANNKDWFILSGSNVRKYRGRYVAGFIARPLTARHHFKNYFLNDYILVAMSATIGNVETFSQELGISSPDSVIIPSNWPPETRPLIVPKDAPRLGMSSHRDGGTAFEKQADIIVKLLRDCPVSWSGVIHVSSKKQARELAGRMANRGFHDRIWMPPQAGTDKQMEAWSIRKERTSGALAITYSWHEGVDLLDEKICILAKVPFPSIQSLYEKARLKYSNSFYQLRTAWALQQACGRTRRGREEDYDIDGKKNGLVAIVDGNWKRVRKYLSQDFLDSIVEI